MNKIIILIPKGRNLLKSLFYLKYYKIYLVDNLLISRKLIYKTNLKFLYIIFVKNTDIDYYLNLNLTDFSFLGKDLLLEINTNIFYKFYNLNIFKFKLSLITNKFFSFKSNLSLFSKYFNISNNYINFLNLKNIKFFKVNSFTELSLIYKKSDLIIDIVSSGKTVIDNNLYILSDVIKFNNILLLNTNIFYNKILNLFFGKLFFLRLFNVFLFFKQNRYQ